MPMKPLRERVLLLLATAIAALSVAGCSKSNNGQALAALNGKWLWYSTSGGFGGSGATSQSTGSRRSLVVGGNHFMLLVDGVTEANGTFAVQQADCMHDASGKRMVIVFNPASKYLPDYSCVAIHGDSLTLSEEAFDGFQYDFIKQ
ncbi:MAG: hypothetical protein QM642_10515 [Edaphocola sp.]